MDRACGGPSGEHQPKNAPTNKQTNSYISHILVYFRELSPGASSHPQLRTAAKRSGSGVAGAVRGVTLDAAAAHTLTEQEAFHPLPRPRFHIETCFSRLVHGSSTALNRPEDCTVDAAVAEKRNRQGCGGMITWQLRWGRLMYTWDPPPP